MSRKTFMALGPALVLVVALAIPCRAQGTTGTRLAEMAQTWERYEANHDDSALHEGDKADIMFFMGYVSAMTDVYVDDINWPESGVSLHQNCAVIAKFLREHPERWGQRPTILITRALLDAFGKAKSH